MDKIEKFYNAHKMGFPVNIRALIKQQGIELRENEELGAEISGELFKENDQFIIATNKLDQEPLRSFAMAHELGHFVFHKSLIGEGVDDNRLFFSTDSGRYNNTEIKRVHEAQANIFACNTLMPIVALAKFVSTQDYKVRAQISENIVELESRFSVPLSVITWWMKIHVDNGELTENASKNLDLLEQKLSDDKKRNY